MKFFHQSIYLSIYLRQSHFHLQAATSTFAEWEDQPTMGKSNTFQHTTNVSITCDKINIDQPNIQTI